MYKYSKTSTRKLRSCDARWQEVFGRLAQKHNITIIEGYRSEKRQNVLYYLGKSKLKFPRSKHNTKPSLAIDAGLYFPGEGIRWGDIRSACYFGGIVMATAQEMFPLTHFRWGGDWNENYKISDESFLDLWHFEIKEGNNE